MSEPDYTQEVLDQLRLLVQKLMELLNLLLQQQQRCEPGIKLSAHWGSFNDQAGIVIEATRESGSAVQVLLHELVHDTTARYSWIIDGEPSDTVFELHLSDMLWAMTVDLPKGA